MARSPEAGVEAIPLFERAIALDPHYTDAYRWLAFNQGTAWVFMDHQDSEERSNISYRIPV
jgi:adenylate cyclase